MNIYLGSVPLINQQEGVEAYTLENPDDIDSVSFSDISFDEELFIKPSQSYALTTTGRTSSDCGFYFYLFFTLGDYYNIILDDL